MLRVMSVCTLLLPSLSKVTVVSDFVVIVTLLMKGAGLVRLP